MARKYRTRIYAIYDGDAFVDVGSKAELFERLGLTSNAINTYASPGYNERRKPDWRTAVFIGYEDELNG